MYRTAPRSRTHPLGRLVLAAAGLAVLGFGWHLTQGGLPSDAVAGEVTPSDYVPQDDAGGVASFFAPDPLAAAAVARVGPGLGAPLDFLRVTSNFGVRHHPILGFSRMHQGVDFGAPQGAPVMAAADGVVTQAGPAGGYGNLIRIRHADGWATGYAHLMAFAPGIADGARVLRGEVIGFVGRTGLATGPHLHYEVSHDGVKLDPLTTPYSAAPTSTDGGPATAPTLSQPTPAAAGLQQADTGLRLRPAQPDKPLPSV